MKNRLLNSLTIVGAVLLAGSVYVGTILLLLYLFFLALGTI